MEPNKINCIFHWPAVTTLKQFCGFLGLARYYHRFIRNFSSLAQPLTELTKYDAFQWNDSLEQTFGNLKQVLTAAPVLKAPDFILPLVVECDASSEGVGAVLQQKNHPITLKGFQL